ncbi:glycosyltransferase [Haloferula sp.]|uniref:glycosyltransferase n=1 Tax=Haloferula sp. TaxID=2497595 RepID=UPI00329ED5DB
MTHYLTNAPDRGELKLAVGALRIYSRREMERLSIDGKYLRVGDRRVFLRMVTYGPFPGGWPEDFSSDFQRIREAGFDSLRLYEWPSSELLNAAETEGLRVFAGLKWAHACDFFQRDELPDAQSSMASGLATLGGHPALAGVFVANEVPADLARWMGPPKVREALEELIALGKAACPELIWCYGNYPGTEYLEPGNADLTAMNVYLENEDDYRAYLKRLHHIAGDRPVLISEFGLDSRRNGLDTQASTLEWGMRAAYQQGMAGLAVYAWSDRWFNAGAEVLDWDFGLIDRKGREKPALSSLEKVRTDPPPRSAAPDFTVIICTLNGRDRIGSCLKAVSALENIDFEVVVVDDGSNDGTPDFIEREFPQVRLVRIEHGGLSAARNAGAEAAKGEILAFTDDDCEPDAAWLAEIAPCFAKGWDAAGGPNLPPPPSNRTEAVVAAAPGAASHVMLDDDEAEHVPGCNLLVRRSAYFDIGGFDPAFRTAGDDVDFCWRLRDSGYRIGFSPTSFVWHHRRPSLRGYLKQQIGYGHAEAMLMRKHPQRFSPSGDAMWHGTIYSGGPVRVSEEAVIYHGPMGMAGYQGVIARVQPLRDLEGRFDTPLSALLLQGISWLAPRLRSWTRIRRFRGPLGLELTLPDVPDSEFSLWTGEDREVILRRLLDEGWQVGGSTDAWDIEKDGTRVLIATEKGEGIDKRTLFRVWGNASSLDMLSDAEPLK